ncbi:MAG: adenylyl-sulfate kinase [Acidobacteriota bacterium]|nr:adenylyl-sulfate kinase [Acidobacteriota bacterium]
MHGGSAADAPGHAVSEPAGSPNVRWHHSEVSRRRRWQTLGARGGTVWLTGLPSSGKSTLGAALEERLVEEGRHAYLLDGDNLRHGLCSDLGFSRSDRERNVRRVGELAALFADSGTIALVALVSPYAAERRLVREQHEHQGLAFIEVFINTPLWVCVERDPKGLYAKALTGELSGFTGVDDPYEPPEQADLEITPQTTLASATGTVLELLGARHALVAQSAAKHPRGATQNHAPRAATAG